MTSEAVDHPIESALRPGGHPGWRAGEPGAQTLCLRFSAPQRLQLIRLVFWEHSAERTQEFVLRWAAESGDPFREIVRQQFTFSPPGTTREIEEYAVDLDGVAALELSITPDIRGTRSHASLAEWLLA